MYAGRESTTSQAKLIHNLHPCVDMPREILILTILTIYYMSLLQWGICHFLLHFFSLMGVIWDLISHLFKYQFECFIIHCEELFRIIYINILFQYSSYSKPILKWPFMFFFSNTSYLRKRLDFRRVHSDELTIWYTKDFQLSPVNSKNVSSRQKILSLDWFTIQSWQVEVQNAKLANAKMTIII